MKKLVSMPSVEEIREWLNIIVELRRENIILKNRLSDAVQGEVDRLFIEEAESFQQHFIDKDQVIELLRHDTTGLLTKINKPCIEGQNLNQLQKQAQALRRDILRIAEEFKQLKISFDRYLAEGPKI